MKRIIASTYITSGSSFPVKSGSWDFLQDESKEIVASTIIGMIGSSYSTSKVYRLYGAELTNFAGDNWLNSVGAVFYNGEVYQVDAVGGSGTSMPDGIDMGIDTSYFTAANADPVTFTDGTPHNVHQIKKMKYVDSVNPLALGVGQPVNGRWDVNCAAPSNNGVAITVTTEASNYYNLYANAAGAMTITISNTNRVEGGKATIYIETNDPTGNSLTFATSSTVLKANTTGTFINKRMIVTIEYAGNDTYYITNVTN